MSPLLDHMDAAYRTGMCSIQFGAPGRNCSGHGICRIEGAERLTEVSSSGKCSKAMASVRLLKHGRLRLHVFKTSICKNLEIRYFSNTALQVLEPVEVHMQHWPESEWQVIPGTYPIRQSDTHFVLHLQIVPKYTDLVIYDDLNTLETKV